MISFLHAGGRVDLDDVEPTTTVLEWLRANGHVGTKEGCASGDCGACTVVTIRSTADQSRSHGANDGDQPSRDRGPDEHGRDDPGPDDERFGDHGFGDSALEYRAVNSCISLVGSLHGCQLVTVEDLADPVTGTLHPVQQAMVDEHGSQCGFCTPGFVMSMFAHAHTAPSVDRHDIDTALSGNLCRCTGYRPIIAAARAVAMARPNDHFDDATDDTLSRLADLDTATHTAILPPSLTAGDRTWVAPRTLAEATALLADRPDAEVVAGATDLALRITQDDELIPHLVDVAGVEELHRVEVDDDRIRLGAAVPLAAAAPVLAEHFPATAELWERYGSVPIRNRATLGGNLATASPIGDSPPVLLALDARVVVAGAPDDPDAPPRVRKVAIDDFFLDYRRTALEPGELIVAITIPMPSQHQHLSVSKVSKRLDDDISAVCAVVNLTLDEPGNRGDPGNHGDGGDVPAMITAARVAFGGMAATPARARACETALVGSRADDDTLARARAALATDFSPIDDMRASANYRETVAANLLTRAFLELGQPPQRVTTPGPHETAIPSTRR